MSDGFKPKDDAKKCHSIGCKNEAKWQVLLKLFAPLDYKAPPAVAEITLFVCDECKKDVKVDDLVSDEGWAMIEEGFAKAGKMLPVRDCTQVDFKMIK